MNDIDLSSVANWEPIGTDDHNNFMGIFDGNGHVIKNLTINRGEKDCVGLFGYAKNATIKNLGLENVDVKGGDCVGGLAGVVVDGTVTNCYTSGNISGGKIIGGLTGGNGHATIRNCRTSTNVSGESVIGGLVGELRDESTIDSSCSSGNVSGKDLIGGIAGAVNGGTLSNSYTSSNVSGNNAVGGLAGIAAGRKTITNCYMSGNVSGRTYTGLICGQLDATITNTWADIKDSDLNMFGRISPISTITNCNAVKHSEFTSHEFWEKQNLDSDVWDMQNCYPPILKGLGGQLRNWYFKESSNEFRLQVGEGSDPTANALFVNTGLDLGAINVDLSTVNGCLDASRCAKAALDAVAQRTADIGVSQSRLETINNINTTKIENLTAAYTTVTEADVAEETMNFTKSQILASTAASLITQTQAFQANLLLRMINSLG